MNHTRSLSISILVSILALVAVGTAGCTAETPEEATEATTQNLAGRTPDWKMLGQRVVNGQDDQDVIAVGVDEGRFDSIQLRALGNSVGDVSVKIVFHSGEVLLPVLARVIEKDGWTGIIDLPGKTRFIDRVELQYSSIPASGRPIVQLWGKSVPSPWVSLGETVVNGTLDRDALVIGGEEGAFTAIQIRVADSSLVMDDIKVVFGNGEVFWPQTRLIFNENSRTKIIDLPGAARHIKRVDFRYGNLPYGGNARLALWAVR